MRRTGWLVVVLLAAACGSDAGVPEPAPRFIEVTPFDGGARDATADAVSRDVVVPDHSADR